MAILPLAEGLDVLERRARLVKALLAGGFVLVIGVLVSEVAEYQGVLDLNDPAQEAVIQLFALLAVTAAIVTIITIILFSMWIYRAAANIVAAEIPGFEYTPGWAVGWYFIPFANLVKPYHAMRQTWNASFGGEGDALNHGNGLLIIWWVSWLLSNIADNISMRLSLRADTFEDIQASLQFGIAGSLLGLILYPAAYRLVDRITVAQRQCLAAGNIFS